LDSDASKNSWSYGKAQCTIRSWCDIEITDTPAKPGSSIAIETSIESCNRNPKCISIIDLQAEHANSGSFTRDAKEVSCCNRASISNTLVDLSERAITKKSPTSTNTVSSRCGCCFENSSHRQIDKMPK